MKTKVSINYLKQGKLKACIFDKEYKELAQFNVFKNENGIDTEMAYNTGKLVKNAYGICINYYINGEVSSSIYTAFY